MRTLYHYTCVHSAHLIDAEGMLVPNGLVVPSLVWLTDLPVPIRHGLGLTSELVNCDRTAWRYTVSREDREACVWWPRWRRAHRDYLPVSLNWEAAPGARPAHWWVSEVPVRVDTPGVHRETGR